ncbi:predicted protein [Histoplasma mississippiense (nom. inval.)]|uniref:predicted protein n=1 Tax=Ajellomyces capsulatus (strain NAm1 / WU24) TaxID=2059318 RepID=UPI000157C73C|nr:predicted protein [Histoplasma mississippiense (nom. inval.)]EDN08865.1 predicted protein [Histoplasma mississippiense (nom. inval.)]
MGIFIHKDQKEDQNLSLEYFVNPNEIKNNDIISCQIKNYLEQKLKNNPGPEKKKGTRLHQKNQGKK